MFRNFRGCFILLCKGPIIYKTVLLILKAQYPAPNHKSACEKPSEIASSSRSEFYSIVDSGCKEVSFDLNRFKVADAVSLFEM